MYTKEAKAARAARKVEKIRKARQLLNYRRGRHEVRRLIKRSRRLTERIAVLLAEHVELPVALTEMPRVWPPEAPAFETVAVAEAKIPTTVTGLMDAPLAEAREMMRGKGGEV